MQGKVCSLILGLYAVIGAVAAVLALTHNWSAFVIGFALFAAIPALCCYGVWRKRPLAYLLGIGYFVFQSIRHVDPNSVIPHIAPITLSFPVGDFANGTGYLVDIFAISMALCLVYLFCGFISGNRIE